MTARQAKMLILALMLVPMLVGYIVVTFAEKGSGYFLVFVSFGLLLSAAFIVLIIKGYISVTGLETITEEIQSEKKLIASMMLMVCVVLVFIVVAL